MTSRMRFSSPGLAFQIAATTKAISLHSPCWLSGSRSRPHGVAQDADPIGLHLDLVPRLQPAINFQPGASGGGSRAQPFAPAPRQILRGVSDHVGETMV